MLYPKKRLNGVIGVQNLQLLGCVPESTGLPSKEVIHGAGLLSVSRSGMSRWRFCARCTASSSCRAIGSSKRTDCVGPGQSGERAAVTCFYSTPFILCGLLARKPPPSQFFFERRNWSFLLHISGHPQFGLPFGQDRLVLIFLATLAVCQKSQVVRFRSAAEMLDCFGMAKGGKEYRRIVSAFERIFGATIFFSTESNRSTATVVHRSRFNFLREAEIWYGRSSEAVAGENVMTLTDEFYAEISSHPIPADFEAIKVLAAALALLDLFMWLSYRCFVAKGPEVIPMFGAFGLTQQLGCVEYSRPSRFRAMLEQWLRTIRSLWPECPAFISADGRTLIIDRRTAILPIPSAT